MTPDVQDAIVRAAQEQGINPSFALAVAQRESNGNPNAHASRTIYGLFQMSRGLRSQYGIGDSQDPYTQASGWAKFAGDLKGEMADRLGRDPTNEELYLGHYFGGPRAARLISGQVPPSADVRDVFTPQEIAANPEFAKAGTVGNLVASVEGDIGRRIGIFGNKNGGFVQSGPDFASFGQPDKADTAADISPTRNAAASAQPVDFARFGTTPAGDSSADIPALAAAATPVVDNVATMLSEPQQQEAAAAPAPPAAPAQVTPAQVAMRNAMAPMPQVQNMPAIPGQQPQALPV